MPSAIAAPVHHQDLAVELVKQLQQIMSQQHQDTLKLMADQHVETIGRIAEVTVTTGKLAGDADTRLKLCDKRFKDLEIPRYKLLGAWLFAFTLIGWAVMAVLPTIQDRIKSVAVSASPHP